MASTAEHIAARNDQDLFERLVATAEKNGIDFPRQWVENNRGKLVSTDIGGTTISDVHAYAVATYDPTPRPGANPAAVTDAQLDAAVDAITPSASAP